MQTVRLILAIMALSAVASASAAALPQKFDLICDFQTGTQHNDDLIGYAPGTAKLSVDLVKKKWCKDRCPRNFQIKKISENEIVFVDANSAPFEAYSYWNILKHDYSDIVESHTRLGLGVISSNGNCRVSEFTGLKAK